MNLGSKFENQSVNYKYSCFKEVYGDTMNLENAIKKPFSDIKTLIIGIALSILPVVNFFAMGFAVMCAGVGKTKPSGKMPEWDNWGDLFVKGLMVTVISIIYFVPALVIILFFAGAMIYSFAGMYFGGNMPMMMRAMSGNQAASMFATGPLMGGFPALIAFSPLIILAGLVGLLAFYVLPIAVLSYAEKWNFGDALKFGPVFKKAFTSAYFVVWIVSLVVLVVLSIVFHWIPIVGSAASFFIGNVINYTLFGEVYKKL